MMFLAAQGDQAENRRRPRRRYGWILFFAVLGALTAAAISFEGLYNAQLKLTPERLADARKKWSAHGPANYHLEYTLAKIGSADKYEVEVRDGRVVWALRNGELEEERLFRYADMRALFRFIEDYQEQDKAPQRPRTYVTATFDNTDGHVLRYTRSVMSKQERQEIRITQFRPPTDQE
jgi:hypothetical protein